MSGNSGQYVTNGRDDRTEPLLECRDVCVSYGGVRAVAGLSLDVGEKEICGLIGPNGAGKTSFIDAISGFTEPSDGTTRLKGHRLEGRKPHQRARLGLIRTFQQLELFTDLSVRENISVAARSTGRGSPADFTRAVELLELAEVLDTTVSDLSHARRQTVALARALGAGPSVLLLDEPAAGLDTTESAILAARMRAIADTGVGILLVDHDMGLVLSVCDWITVVDFGHLIAEGQPAHVRTDEKVIRAYLGEE